MKANIKYALLILVLTAIYSCGSQKEENTTQIAVVDSLTDSAKIARYLKWNDSIEIFKVYDYDKTALRRIEQNRDTAALFRFLQANYDSVKLFDEFPKEAGELVNSVYAIDLNGDKLNDIVYNGTSGGEGTITQIFLNNGDHYTKVFSGYQDVIDVEFDNNKLKAFTLIHPGCCADPQIAEYYYSVKYVGDQPQFKLEKTIGYLSNTEKPATKLPGAAGFSVVSAKAKLRTDCYLLDNVGQPVGGDGEGNVIAVFKQSAKGKVLGTKHDKNMEWVYVSMNADNKPDTCYNQTFMEQPTEIRGWMQKTDIDWK